MFVQIVGQSKAITDLYLVKRQGSRIFSEVMFSELQERVWTKQKGELSSRQFEYFKTSQLIHFLD